MLRHAQDLEGDPLARDELACPVDVRHAARSDQRLQLETRIERLPGLHAPSIVRTRASADEDGLPSGPLVVPYPPMDREPGDPAAPRLPVRASIYIAPDGTVHFGALFADLRPVAAALSIPTSTPASTRTPTPAATR